MAHTLSACCEDLKIEVLITAVLHDTIEDTNTAPEKILEQLYMEQLASAREMLKISGEKSIKV